MRKKILSLALSAVFVLALAVGIAAPAQASDYYYISTTQARPDPIPISPPIAQFHFFATALREFNAGAMPGGHTAAVLTHLQGFLDEVVVAVRMVGTDGTRLYEMAVFANENGRNVSIPIPDSFHAEPYHVLITKNNHLAVLGHAAGPDSFNVYEYSNGTFVNNGLFAGMESDASSNYEDYFAHFHNGNMVSEQEYKNLIAKFGLDGAYGEYTFLTKNLNLTYGLDTQITDHTEKILTMIAAPSMPTAQPAFEATPSQWRFNINGDPMLGTDMYNIADQNYLKIIDIAYLLDGTDKQFSFDRQGDTVHLLPGQKHNPRGDEMTLNPNAVVTTAELSAFEFMLNGEPANLTAYLIADSNYVRIRDVLRLFDVYVDYDVSLGEFYLDTSKAYVEN